ncbi:MAG: hypothetical protein LBR56_06645, partial [Sporomusaceae bacterium]|nr:hypothetical protein [Sporomusaceae bacterium]
LTQPLETLAAKPSKADCRRGLIKKDCRLCGKISVQLKNLITAPQTKRGSKISCPSHTSADLL